MDEATEMTRKGILCQACGAYMGDSEDEDWTYSGHAATCAACERRKG